MEINELVMKRKRDFNISICLTGIIPFLVFLYLLVNRISTFQIFVGEVGYIMFTTIIIFLLGIAVGRKMLMNMLDELIERNKLAAITETALTLSHEINNPLLIVTGNLELLETDFTGTPIPDSAKNRVNIIKSHCERIRVATDKLARLSKPVSEAIHGNARIINLNKSQ